MSDPIRHPLVSFETRIEAERFSNALTEIFCPIRLDNVLIEEEFINRESVHVVSIDLKRLHLPRRIVTFAMAWVQSRESQDFKLLIEDKGKLYLS